MTRVDCKRLGMHRALSPRTLPRHYQSTVQRFHFDGLDRRHRLLGHHPGQRRRADGRSGRVRRRDADHGGRDHRGGRGVRPAPDTRRGRRHVLYRVRDQPGQGVGQQDGSDGVLGLGAQLRGRGAQVVRYLRGGRAVARRYVHVLGGLLLGVLLGGLAGRTGLLARDVAIFPAAAAAPVAAARRAAAVPTSATIFAAAAVTWP